MPKPKSLRQSEAHARQAIRNSRPIATQLELIANRRGNSAREATRLISPSTIIKDQTHEKVPTAKEAKEARRQANLQAQAPNTRKRKAPKP